jgi:hypothetical protein
MTAPYLYTCPVLSWVEILVETTHAVAIRAHAIVGPASERPEPPTSRFESSRAYQTFQLLSDVPRFRLSAKGTL